MLAIETLAILQKKTMHSAYWEHIANPNHHTSKPNYTPTTAYHPMHFKSSTQHEAKEYTSANWFTAIIDASVFLHYNPSLC
mmetsp:Transcript_18560/g.31052  ORF Transcript_18560/g.31052 Transcript_18560/m.31052 type:complete len:81 (-) Transcript_18560:181-423(-)